MPHVRRATSSHENRGESDSAPPGTSAESVLFGGKCLPTCYVVALPGPLVQGFCNIRDNLTTNFLVNTAKTERDAKGF
jgi:hypothetical protein